MRRIVVVLSGALLSASAFAQDIKLPDVLRPSANSIAAAEQSGVEVFKLLPRGMFDSSSHDDKDNPIGIRGGGAYYSFMNRLHSYNKVPQIEYQKGGLSVGFYGANYGFIHDIGPGSLTDVSLEIGTPKFLTDYQPPVLYEDIRKEAGRSSKYENNSGVFMRRVPAVTGHIYLLRAISVGEADVLVAFQIREMEKDGSLTIGWKRVKEFDVPKLLYQTDEILRAKVDAVLDDPRYRGVTAVVKDDQVTLTGSVAADDYAALLTVIMQKANPRGLDNRLVKRQR